LSEEDSEEYENETADLVKGEPFTSDRRTEQDTGDRVEQSDEANGSGADMSQPGEPAHERECGRDDRDKAERYDRRSSQSGRLSLHNRGGRRQDGSPGDVVAPTKAGKELIDQAFTEHMRNERRLLNHLSPDDAAELEKLLTTWLACFETPRETPT
jgi:hypothetical protein